MPGKSKEGGGLESSPVYKKQEFGAPFKMKGHALPGPNQASPMKSWGLLGKTARFLGKKLVSKFKAPKSLPKSKSADFKGTLRRHGTQTPTGSYYPVGKRHLTQTYPGKLASTNQPNFMGYTSKALQHSQETWFPGMKYSVKKKGYVPK